MGVDYDYVQYPQAKEGDGGEATWASQKSKLELESPNVIDFLTIVFSHGWK